VSIGNVPSGEVEGGDSERFVAVETYTSREFSLASLKQERRREFIVYARETTTELLLNIDQAGEQTGVKFGDPHPDDPRFVAVDFRSAFIPEAGRRAARIEIVYRPFVASEIPVGPEEETYQEINIDGDLEFVDTWREQSDDPPMLIPLNGNAPKPRVDIGGCSIDIAGQPVSRPLRTGRWQITRNYSINEYNAGQLLYAVGTRNNATFLGFPTGSALYGRPKSTRVAEGIIKVVHEIIVDPVQFHMRQSARADENGIELVNGGLGSCGAGQRAAFVYWVQPFPTLIDFNALNIIQP
jgi:hypothetical protein